MEDAKPAQSKLSPYVQAGIAAALLLMFFGVLFLKAMVKDFEVDADTKQTLFTLVTAVVFFFIGKNTESASREAAITAAALAPLPPAPTPAPPPIPAAVAAIPAPAAPVTEEAKP
jgi:hypothetical protein